VTRKEKFDGIDFRPILVNDWSKKLNLLKEKRPDPGSCTYHVLREPSRLELWHKALQDFRIKSELRLSQTDEKALLPIKVSFCN
jgi:hypothetical protein